MEELVWLFIESLLKERYQEYISFIKVDYLLPQFVDSVNTTINLKTKCLTRVKHSDNNYRNHSNTLTACLVRTMDCYSATLKNTDRYKGKQMISKNIADPLTALSCLWKQG